MERMSAKETDNNHGRWVTTGAAARQLDVNPETIRRWADEGKIPSRVTLGGHRRVQLPRFRTQFLAKTTLPVKEKPTKPTKLIELSEIL